MYRGKVGSGFGERDFAELASRLHRLRRKNCPFDSVPDAVARKSRWVTPRLVAEIRYTELTADGMVQHGVFEGLRTDKEAAEVGLETPAAVQEMATDPPDDTRVESGEARIGGTRISGPGRVVWPGTGLTKAGLARYCDAVAGPMLAHARNRPLSLLRCPDGIGGDCCEPAWKTDPVAG